MVTDDAPILAIGEVAEAVGITPAVLRTWEARFGFPTGTRTSSGHRRFSRSDLAAVREVLALRDSGAKLETAVREVRARREQAASRSVHGELTARYPDLAGQRLRRDTLIAVSRAIEDECVARTDRPLVLGSFQRGAFFDRVASRWRELARTSLWSAAFGDFQDGLPRAEGQGPVLVHLPDDSPMLREWTVACVSPRFCAVLTAWQVPGQEQETSRSLRYESVLCTRPAVAVAAARVLLGVAEAADVRVPADVYSRLDEGPHLGSMDTDRLFGRAMAYLDHDLPR